jgi:hypothetical protein
VCDVTLEFCSRLEPEQDVPGVLSRQADEAVKKPRFTEEQILIALKQYAAGQAIADFCNRSHLAPSPA